MALEAYDAYKIYHALKLHFNSNYDFNRYNGKANVSVSSFLKRKDRPFFAKVARKYITGENTKKFFISNFIKNPRGWIGDFNEEHYVQYKKRIQSLRYNYTNELLEIFKKVKSFDEIFQVNEGQHSLLLKQFLAKNISLETMCILERLVGYTKYWNDNIDENIVWPIWEKLIVDYIPFLTFDRESYKIITMQTVKETFIDG